MIWLLRISLGFAALFWPIVWLSTVVEYRRRRWVLKIATPLPPAPKPRVSVIVPARNEERNLKSCLDTLRALEWPDLEILVLDDRSTDATPKILAETPGVKALSGTDLPDGWMGKCWALHQAQSHATGEWLLFVDADVTVHPKALSQAHAYATHEKARMLSGYGYLRLETFWENVIMPVLGGMIVGANPLQEVNDPKHDRVVCNGQFILIARDAYDAIGGHAAVKAEIIDDMALAREAKKKGVAYRMIFCRELFTTRMYTSFVEIWRGWTKNLYAALGYRPQVALWAVAFIFVTAVLPPLGMLARDEPSLALAAFATAVMLGYRIHASVIFDHDWRWFWSHPLGALVCCGIFLESARRGLLGRTVEWKGRHYGAAGPKP